MNIDINEFIKILLTHDDNKFVNFIIESSHDFWSIDFINKIVINIGNNNPVFFGEFNRVLVIIIFRMVSLFGIRKLGITYDVNYWLKYDMPHKFPDPIIQDKIKNNENLLEFLKVLIACANCRFFGENINL